MAVSLSPVNSVHQQREDNLLASFFSGNQQAYWQLWELYDRKVYYYCLMFMRNNIDDAEDAKQEIMCKGFSKLAQYKQRLTSFNALLMAMARNTCRDIVRRKRIICWVTFQENYHDHHRESSPEMALIRGEERRYLEGAIAQLSPTQNYVINCYYLQGIPHSEIARNLNIKPATSRKHAEKGVKNLRKKLGDS